MIYFYFSINNLLLIVPIYVTNKRRNSYDDWRDDCISVSCMPSLFVLLYCSTDTFSDMYEPNFRPSYKLPNQNIRQRIVTTDSSWQREISQDIIKVTAWNRNTVISSIVITISPFISHIYWNYFTLWSCLWSYGSWIHNYQCNQCLSPLKLRVWTPHMAKSTRYIMW
jgi:hypothetical protein